MDPLVLSLFAKAVSIEYRLLTQFWVEENIEILFVYSIPMLYVHEIACKLRDEYRMFVVFEQQRRRKRYA